jgi:hypothetical protein
MLSGPLSFQKVVIMTPFLGHVASSQQFWDERSQNRIFLTDGNFALGYGTSNDYGIMEISHDTKIICKGTKVYSLYMLDNSIINLLLVMHW